MISTEAVLWIPKPPTADGEANSSTAGHRQENCSCWVLEQKARKREGRDIRGHVGLNPTVSTATYQENRLLKDLIPVLVSRDAAT